MSCKDCIHYEDCHIAEWFEVGKEYAENSCRFFKDRSKFIELPCKVGDIVYKIFENVKGKVIGEREVMGIHSKNHNPCLIIDGWEMQPFNMIGKTVFLTKEGAEQALKERKNEKEL